MIALTLSLSAQITLTTTDMPTAGWTNVMAKDTSISAINWGSRGANQVYTFTALQHNVGDSAFYAAPTSAQSAAVAGTNLTVTNDHNTFLLIKNAASKLDYEGLETTLSGYHTIVALSPVGDLYHFGTTYGGAFTGTSGFTTTAAGSAFTPSLPVSQARVTNTTTYHDTIDGWGKVTTPVGSYKCLRQKRIEISSTVIDYKLLSISPWANYQTINTTTTKYYYLTKETHGSVISFNYDSLNNPTSASWSLTPPAKAIPRFVFSYGANGAVAFTDSTDGYPDTYSWSFGDGSPFNPSQSPNHTYGADSSYVVCLTVTNPSGSNTYCDTVHIANRVNGIEELSTATIQVYPNPAASTINIDMTGVAESTRKDLAAIEVYNMVGERLITQPTIGSELNISTDVLSNGLYMLVCRDAQQNRKLIGRVEVIH